jgi:hypothetical protein
MGSMRTTSLPWRVMRLALLDHFDQGGKAAFGFVDTDRLHGGKQKIWLEPVVQARF